MTAMTGKPHAGVTAVSGMSEAAPMTAIGIPRAVPAIAYPVAIVSMTPVAPVVTPTRSDIAHAVGRSVPVIAVIIGVAVIIAIGAVVGCRERSPDQCSGGETKAGTAPSPST